MKVLITVLCVVFIGLVSNLSAQTSQNKVEDKIQGKWRAVKVLFKGEEVMTKEEIKATRLEFLAGGVHKTILADGKIVYGKYSIDTSKSPLWLTYKGNRDAPFPYDDINISSIFKVDGDRLLIVSNTAIRPIDFTSDEINENILEEYVRVEERFAKL